MEITMSRRERERQMRREAMLRAALAVFAEKGYARATLEEIAQRAEFGKGTLYNYFENGKEGMLFAIFDEIYEGLIELIDDAFSGTESRPLRETMRTFIAACLQFFTAKNDVFTIVMKEAYRMILSEDPALSEYFQKQHQRVVSALSPHLDRAMQRGEMRRFEPEAVAHTLMGNINGIQMHVCLSGNGGDPKRTLTPESAADFMTTVLMDGLLARNETTSRNGED